MRIVVFSCKEAEAEAISSVLVEKKLAACCNIISARSVFIWEKKLVKEKESLVYVKTTESKEKEVYVEIKKLSSYKVPMICTMTSGSVDKAYCRWIEGELK